jgi:hypothetical protein
MSLRVDEGRNTYLAVRLLVVVMSGLEVAVSALLITVLSRPGHLLMLSDTVIVCRGRSTVL